MRFTHFIGIDVSKDTLDVCVVHENQKVFSTKVTNSMKDLNELWKQLRRTCINWDANKVLVCLEHTGIYGNFILDFLNKKKVAVCLENPVQIKLSIGLQRGKNDAIDAERIARYASKENENLKLWTPPRQEVILLKNLSVLRSRLIKSKKALTVPVEELKKFDKETANKIAAHTMATVRHIMQDLKKIDQSINEIIKNDENLKRLFKIITSVSGVGPITAVEVIIATNEFQTIKDPRKFACYAGVAPFEHSSGKSIRGKSRVSHKANKRLKTLLCLGALALIKSKSDLRSYYERKVKEGKNKMSVLNAVKNKIIHRIFVCVEENRIYQKKYSPTLV
jgi:transposase